MILLWGLPGDSPVDMVHGALQKSGCDVAFFDQRSVLDSEIELCIGSAVEGTLRIGERIIDLCKVSAVYLRPYEFYQIPHIQRAGQGSLSWRHAERMEELLMTWVELTTALVVNRPSAMAANGSKPYQAAWIRSFGFEVPETLITTDPDAVLEFWPRHGTIIYKSVSAVRSIVTRLTEAHLARLEHVAWCPTQFQQYIPGTDYRVHVVGSQVFASQVVSDGDDYRYAARQGGTTSIYPYDLPEEIALRCINMAAAMELPVAGIDLRCTPEGVWYCFEVNPSPGFAYFQDSTQQPIDEAIARLLMSGAIMKERSTFHGSYRD